MANKVTKERVAVVIGRFQPFTISHLKLVRAAYDKLGLKVVIGVISSERSSIKNDRDYFSTNIVKNYMGVIERSYKMIEDVLVFENMNAFQVMEKIAEKYDVASLFCGSDRYPVYKKMEDYADDLGLDEGFQVREVYRTNDELSATDARNAILNKNKNKYKEVVDHNLATDDMYELLSSNLISPSRRSNKK